jgi:hypothetical protein
MHRFFTQSGYGITLPISSKHRYGKSKKYQISPVNLVIFVYNYYKYLIKKVDQ